ncbi:MAG TPA: hypothetical protein VMN38_10330 [Sphingomicrobium sp.]|nr:hypothetical protein [Sphingomicrobium sp.]
MRDAVFVVAVEAEQCAAAVGDRDDAAALVGAEEPSVSGATAIVPDYRIVDAGSVDVAPLERIGAVIFGDAVEAVLYGDSLLNSMEERLIHRSPAAKHN